jgi:hypothetical protein
MFSIIYIVFFIIRGFINPCWMMKWQWSVWLNSGWLLRWLWNVDRVLDECWNNDENVNVLKWPVWDGYIIVLQWILNRLWEVDWAIMNLGCWRMVVWVLQRTYYFIYLSNVRNCIDQKWKKASEQQIQIYRHVQTGEQREQAPLNKKREYAPSYK